MTDSKATKYIYHSEKTKTTCYECKKHDREVYYDIKDIPKLPMHPNCKCWIETIELPANKNTKCDCIDRFKVLTDNLNNLINNTNIIKESYKDELTECLNELSNINSEYVRENISEIDKNKFQEKIYNIEDKIYYFEKDLNNFIKKEENLLTDIEMTKEFSFDNTYHTKEQCLSNKDLINHSKNLSTLCSTIDDFSDRLKQIKEDRKDISREIQETIKEEKKQEKETKQLKEGKITGGAARVNTETDFLKQNKYNILININERLNKNRSNAKDLANIFLMKPKNAPKSREYRSLGTDCAETVNRQYKLINTNKEVGKDWSGFAYYQDSTLAKNVSNSIEMQNQVKRQFDNILKNFKTDKIEISFSDPNLHLALGHATILNPYLDNNGYFHGILFDKYDFDPIYKMSSKNPFVYVANDYFWYLQERDRNRNFYILAPISFKW